MTTDLKTLPARFHRAFNDRDFDVWREVFDEDVELIVDGTAFRGVDAAVGYGVMSVTHFPGLCVASERIVAETGDTIVVEILLVTATRPVSSLAGRARRARSGGSATGGPCRSAATTCPSRGTVRTPCRRGPRRL